MTECTHSSLEFEPHFRRAVVADFQGGAMTSDGGALLLRQMDRRLGLLQRLADCFTDFRSPGLTQHGVQQMLAQRIYGLPLGYEDLNDHDQLRRDPLMNALAGQREPDQPLASNSTLCRLERTPADGAAQDRYKKIRYHAEAIDELLLDLFLEAPPEAPTQIVLDLDVTGTRLHGRVDYVFGLARNERLRRRIRKALHRAKAQTKRTGQPARIYTEFRYRTRKSGSRPRRVVAKAEQIEGKQNPRYVVTSLAASAFRPRALYEDLYCAGGEMENRIKEQMLRFAGRMSAETMRANQLRLYLSAAAYVPVEALRRLALKGTELAQAQVNTIRLRLLKIGARVRWTARRVPISMASAYPWQSLFAHTGRALGI